MADEAPNPSTPSGDYVASAPYWAMASAILIGAEALRAAGAYGSTTSIFGPHLPFENLSTLQRRNSRNRGTLKGSRYLPQFPNETSADYEMRRQTAPLTNIYADISRNLASKPFSKTLQLEEGAGADLDKLAENIDGQGNNLHVFSRTYFKAGLDKGIDWIFVDYNKVAAPITLATERALGVRPYWVRIPCERMLAVYSAFLNGQEVFVHARIYEPCMERDGYDEVEVEYVRVLNRTPLEDGNGKVTGYAPASWQLYENKVTKDAAAKKETKAWIKVDEGLITIGIIPLVPFVTGVREGSTWRVEPPLKDLAYMQIEEFQQESNLKTIKELTAFPMLAGDGVAQPKGSDGENVVVPVGPRSVLFTGINADGSHGSWKFVEPNAASLKFLQEDLEKHRTEMRDLGMQPLSAANLTVVTTKNLSVKANSAVQAWAIAVKDALEQAMKITCMWLGQKDKEPVVKVHTDFGVEAEEGAGLDALLKAEGQMILSKRTVQEEFKRRGVLSDDFDPDDEEERLAEQQEGQQLEPEKMIDPVTGRPVVATPEHGIPNPPPKPLVKKPAATVQ